VTFLLSSQNVFEYLIDKKLCTQQERDIGEIEPKTAKNFNLLLNLNSDRHILVKQERYNKQGKTAGEFLSEWRIQEFVRKFPEITHLRFWLPEILHFDADNSIVVVKYLSDYDNLLDFYTKENQYPVEIATAIGKMVAAFHRSTLDRQEYRKFFGTKPKEDVFNPASRILYELGRLTPEIFGEVPSDGLKFLALYQRYESLSKALFELSQSIEPCCIAHNDLKLNNILLPQDWESTSNTKEAISLKLIDWERSDWGDPSFDLGTLIGSYLSIWLGSLVVSQSIAIEEALRMAMTPLETIAPSLGVLICSYLTDFPEILERRPDFLKRVVQFAGLSLINGIQSNLQYQKSFNNTGICMLQVAKSLLCRPEASIATVFGIEESKILDRVCISS
jgi:hypothetical protein